MRNNDFILALNALCTERELSKEVVFDAIETALHAAYRRDFEHEPNITVKMDRTNGDARVYVEWKVVDNVEDVHLELSLEEARAKFGPQVQLGDTVHEERTPQNFGRIAAQTAKQVILQRLREAERDRLYLDFADRENEIVMGTVQSIDSKSGAVRLSMGKAEALLPRSEQLPGEKYRIGQRVRAFVYEVSRATRGPQITVSRTHRQMLRRLLELEVPEIANGTVEIRSIAREAGARSKVSVAALQPGIDPVGACVGMKGTRIQSIVNELNGEKIDVVQWSPDEGVYVANALSPAKVIEAFLEEENEEGKTAIVVVPDKQLSLAIGKEGQNARLAAKLTGWRIDIKSATEAAEERVRLTEREARRREDESRRREEEEARLAAARALLAAADAVEETDEPAEGELAVVSAADGLAFSEPAVVSPIVETEEEPVSLVAERPVAEPLVEPPVVEEAPASVTTPAPVAEPARPVPAKPAPVEKPKVATPAPKPVQPVEEWVEEEEEEEEEEIKPSSKAKAPMIFYTLNDRGEAESLDDMVERKQKARKNKGKGREGDRGKARRSTGGRKPWEDNNW